MQRTSWLCARAGKKALPSFAAPAREHLCLYRAPILCSHAPRFGSSVFLSRSYGSDPSPVPFPDTGVSDWKPVENWDQWQFPPRIKALADQILALNQIDLLQLMRLIQRQTGQPYTDPASQPAVVYAAPAAQAEVAPAVEVKQEPPVKEKKSFSLVLTAITEDAKFKVLKEVRVLKPGMKLMESKALIDKLPSTLKEEVPKEEAEKLVALFKELGGTLEMQ